MAFWGVCVCCVFFSVLSCFCISKTCFNSALYNRQTDFRLLERKETWSSKHLLFLPWLIFSLPAVSSFPLSELQPGLESVVLCKQPAAPHIFSSLSFLLPHRPTAQTTISLKLQLDAFSQKHLIIRQANTSIPVSRKITDWKSSTRTSGFYLLDSLFHISEKAKVHRVRSPKGMWEHLESTKYFL